MSAPAIQISELTKRYGRDRGIENISLQVEEGEIFGFIGPNGAGKSTTIRVLLNLLFPTGGSATIMGHDSVKDSRKIREHSGYIPSEANPYPDMSVREFLRYCASFYGMTDAEKRTGELMDLFGAEPGRRISDLSSGNRKKLSIIQGFLHRPRLLIVDEPTTGLDPLMQSRFFDLLRSENRNGMTVFFSSHTLSDVQMLCGRVAIIREGQIVNVEEIEALRKKQLRRVRVEFAENGGDNLAGLTGIEKMVAVSEKKVEFIFSGDMNMLISALRGRTVSDLTIEEPSLEEIFMHYYNQEGTPS
ncbi:MAG: ABC transporter ATP-binding protein [Bacteroidota bacterium]|nr:ABC transporter ATP-binding protein [Bacteroidota bacterium]